MKFNPIRKREIFGLLSLCFMIMFLSLPGFGQKIPDKIDPHLFGDNAGHWYGIADKQNMINALPDKPRYRPADVRQIADNILLFQKDNGGWPKNYDMFAILTEEQKKTVAGHKADTNTTFDNGTCYSQIEALAIAYANTHEAKYKDGAKKGLEFILSAQYPNGGWPQYFPLRNNYSRHITYNDGAMIGIMRLLEDIKNKDELFDFIDGKLRKELYQSYEDGISCILKTQITDHGVLTAWCQQHDEVTLKPAWARTFEPAAICNGESSDIVLFLMSLRHPDQAVITAVQSAVKWFEASEIMNTRVKTVKRDTLITNFRVSTTDRIVVKDSGAPPIWTRYYEPGTDRPVFCNRDGKIVYSLAEVKRERRDGYAWYVYNPQKVLDKYPAWEQKWIKK